MATAEVSPHEVAVIKWFFAEIGPGWLSANNLVLPMWKASMTKSVANLLLAMLAGSVAFADVTHPAQHNSTDGGHKTVQAQASGRREDGGVLADGHLADSHQTDGHREKAPKPEVVKSGGEQAAGGIWAAGGVNAQQGIQCQAAEQLIRLAASLEELKAMVAETRAGVVGLAMGPPIAGDEMVKVLAALARLELGQEKLLTTKAEKCASRTGPLDTEIEPVSEGEAARVFALMKVLDDGLRNRKAPLSRVFRLLVIEGLSQGGAAKRCACSPGLVSARVIEIERRMGRPVTELRALASRLGEMEVAAEDSRARKIYRRGLVDDTEEEEG